MDIDNTSKQGAEGTDNMNDEIATPGQSDTEKQPGQEQDKSQQVETPAPQADKPPRRFLTRTGAARRRASEATLMTKWNSILPGTMCTPMRSQSARC